VTDQERDDINSRFAATWEAHAKTRDQIAESFKTTYQDFLVAVSDIRTKMEDLKKENERLMKKYYRMKSVLVNHKHDAKGGASVDLYEAMEELDD
jgi:hypothetical protein